MNLLFDSLEIKGFRAFKDLRIEKLGRVNLIVGQNNVGKTCLLEALRLYACRAHPSFLWQLLEAHDEDSRPLQSASSAENVDLLLSIIKKLFYEWPDLTKPVEPIEIGPIDQPEATLRLSLEWGEEATNGAGHAVPLPLLHEDHKKGNHAIPHFAVQLGENQHATYPLETADDDFQSKIPPLNCVLTNGHGLDKKQVSALWDRITSPDLYQEVLKALRLLTPGVKDICFIEEPGTKRGRFPAIVMRSDPTEAYPLRSFGEGMQHMLAIILSLINAKDGLLLIDEIEHGLYYYRQDDLWKLIFQLAHQLNVQVFVAAHSWDSVLTFKQALRIITKKDASELSGDPDDSDAWDHLPIFTADKQGPQEGMLIRLHFKNDDVRSALYYAWMLADPDIWHIEVR